MKNWKKDNAFNGKHEREDAFLVAADWARKDLNKVLMLERSATNVKQTMCPICGTMEFPQEGDTVTDAYTKACSFCTQYIKERAERFAMALKNRKADRWAIVGVQYLYQVDAEKVKRAKYAYDVKSFYSWRMLPAKMIAKLYLERDMLTPLTGRDIQTLPENVRTEVWAIIDESKVEMKQAASTPATFMGDAQPTDGFNITALDDCIELNQLSAKMHKKEECLVKMTLGKKQWSVSDMIRALPSIVKEFCGMTEQEKKLKLDGHHNGEPGLF